VAIFFFKLVLVRPEFLFLLLILLSL